jgi:uncharacterized protein (TIGR03435 family)
MRIARYTVALLAVSVCCQTPIFEVASVKPAAQQTGGAVFAGIRGGPGTQDATRISYMNQSFRNLLTEAYGINAWQLSGPDWMGAQRYDIVAGIPEGATKDQVHLMLQNLLVDRFKAVVRRESRDFPIFTLTVAKSGSKLKPSSTEPSATASTGPNPIGSDGFPQLSPGATALMGVMHNGVLRLLAGKQTMQELARALENEFGTRVVDNTGLTGTYDFTLTYVRDLGSAAGAPVLADNSPAPDLATALQEQLGLKVEKSRGPVEVIVLVSANKIPTEN